LLDSQYGTNEPTFEGGDTKVIGMKDIQNGKIITDDLTSSSLPKDEREKYLLHRGDLLINRTNSYDLVGKVGIFESDEEVAFASYLVRLIIDRTQIRPEYLNYWLNSFIAQTTIKRIATRAIGQANVNPTEFKKHCPIPLPPLSEQKDIIDLLSTWDQAIEKTEELISEKENHLRSLSVSLLYRKRYANVDTHFTKWFSVPRHWEITKIGQIAKEITLKNTTGESLPVLSCTKYDGLVDSLKYFDKQIYSEDTSTYKVVKKGQFAYATNHIEEGSIGYQDLYPKGLVSPMYTVFETNNEIIDGFLYKVLKTETYRHIFEINTSASVDRRGSLRWNQFSLLPIPLPPLKEQEEINDSLDLASKEITLLKQILEAYRKQKRGLMQKLLTGQWRVKTDLEEVV
jgi:type I restriction enzyme S subunit